MTAREDVAEVKQNSDVALANADVEKPARKPAPARNPNPTVGYIVVCPGWDPRIDRVSLWDQVPLKEAQVQAEHSEWLGSTRTVVVEVTTTFRIVEDGGRG